MPYSHLSNAVISDSTISEHDIAMVQKDVAVRIGDDAVQVHFDDAPEENSGEDEGRTEITLDTETHEVAGEDEGGDGAEGVEGSDEGTDELEQGDGSDDLSFADVDPKAMIDAAQSLQDAQKGQDELFAQAVEKGLEQEQIDSMQEYYLDHGRLSKAHYAALESVGYTKAFIDSYIQGQDAVATRFANAVMDYVGGEENYHKVTAFMAKHQSHTVDAFNAAIERGDTATMRALLDATKTAMGSTPAAKPQSKAPKRNVTASAKSRPVKAAPAAVTGFTNRAEMVKAMSDPRYGTDAAYRREVELKVFNASF